MNPIKEPAESRVALIAGGVRGIGRAVATALAKSGWTVDVCYRANDAAAAELKAALNGMGAIAQVRRTDVSVPSEAEALVRRVEETYGRIDALINCVGSYHRVHLMQESIENWHSEFNRNLHPAFYLGRAVVPGMIRRKWGRIINFSMVNADQHVGQPYVTAHYISKIGVAVLTRSLAKIVAPHGITANVISPGFIDTGNIPPEEMDRSIKGIPAGYMGKAEDAAGAVLYLLSDQAQYVNGSNIQVSGAWGV